MFHSDEIVLIINETLNIFYIIPVLQMETTVFIYDCNKS